ncbi:hypothetical protein FRC03_000114 [Tulasnella sp. 419]|nr:hypothetical protein FRC03_000114 [Tulasnella sp. 419]
MSRLGVPSTLTNRDRSGQSGHSPSSYNGTPYSVSPSPSGRTSPYPGGVNGYGAQRTAEDLEGQNDERLEGLTAKVKLLKDITIGIGNEVRDSTIQLSQMVRPDIPDS